MKASVKCLLVMGTLVPFSPAAWADVIFKEDKLTVTNKNFYFYRDFRNGEYNPSGANKFVPIDEKEGYRSEWAHGLILNYDSGFTDGAVQFGVNAYGLFGFELYSDPFKTGTSNLQIDHEGNAKSAFGEVGASLKVKYKDTVLTYGNQFPNVPVLWVNTARLLPSTATGLSLQDKSFEHLTLNAGYFYSMNPVDSTEDLNYFTTDYSVGIQGESVKYLGGTYKFPEGSATAYVSELEDVWIQTYAGADYLHKINEQQSLKLNFNTYNNQDTGKKNGGDISTTIASAMLGYSLNNHKISVAYQQVFGDEPADWAGFATQGPGIAIANAVQFATFSEANEKSAQIRYDLDFSPYGIPGLSFMGRYLYGWDMDNQDSTNAFYTKRHVYDPSVDNKHWERDLQLGYTVQKGKAKGLNVLLRQATHRSTQGYRYNDIDELRVILEYPLNF
ncbi:MAG: OprD family outer membrane porin [Acinetobacter sp.]